MKLLRYLMIFLFPLLITIPSCKLEDKPTRGSFLWEDKETHKQYAVQCKNDCSSCSGWTMGANIKIIFDKTKNPAVYKRCAELDSTIIDEDTNSTALVQFFSSPDEKWGWDGYLDNKNYDPINYISMATQDSTEFIVKINSNDKLASRYIATIIKDQTGQLSFSSWGICTQCTLSVGKTAIKLYSKSVWEGTAQIKVISESKGGTICLAGPYAECFGGQDQLIIQAYKRRSFDSVRLYRVNNPIFNPSDNAWKSIFNPIIKQAVLVMGAPMKESRNTLSWDVNNNGVLDIWEDEDSTISQSIREYTLLFYALNENGKCDKNKQSAIVILPHKFQTDWLMLADAPANTKIIKLNTLSRMSRDAMFKIGPWVGNANVEKIVVDSVLSGGRIKVQTPLQYSHYKNDIVFYEGGTMGASKGSCNCMPDQPSDGTLVHEFLHQKRVGDLYDVDDSDNVMFYTITGNKDSKLRQRPVDIHNGNGAVESQWPNLHK